MTTVIDPRLPAVPVKEVKYEERDFDYGEFPEIVEVVTNIEDTEYVYDDPDGISLEPENLLRPPATVSVISQTVRITSAGTQTVDIVIEVEDVPGASEYERRDAV